MAKLTTICPVCENDISIASRDIKLAVMQKGKTAGKTIIGCPACARVLVIEDAPEKDISQWVEKVSADEDWLGCIPLLNPEQAKIPSGTTGDLAFIQYKPGGGGELDPGRVGQQRGSPGGRRLGGELGAVVGGAGQPDVEVTGLHPARIEHHPVDQRVDFGKLGTEASTQPGQQLAHGW